MRRQDLLALFALAALFTGVHWMWSDPFGADLRPTPDAMEYVGQAESILHHGVPALELSDGGLYPSRYSQGFPLLLALWRAMTIGGQTSALSFNWIMSLLGLLLTYLVGRHLAGRAGAFAAASLWVLAPRPMDFAELVVNEPTATVLVLLITAVAISRSSGGRKRGALAIGMLAGFLCAVRLTHVLTLIYVMPLALLMVRRNRGRDLAWGVLGFLPWVIGIAALQQWLNGSWRLQGYDLWAPYATSSAGWNWRYFVHSDFPGRLPQSLHPHWQTYPLMLLGLAPRGYGCITFYGWPVALGVVWTMLTERRPLRRRWMWCILAGVGAAFVVWSFYYFWDSRFFMPLMPLVMLLGCAALVPRLREGWSPANGTRALLLVIAFWQSIGTMIFYLGVQRPWENSERTAMRAIAAQAPKGSMLIGDWDHILTRSEIRFNPLMNWAIDGRDLLLYESRQFHVPPIHPATRPAALFNGAEFNLDAVEFVEQMTREGHAVWLVLYAQAVGDDLNQRRLTAVESAWSGTTEVQASGDGVYRIYQLQPHP